MEFKVQYLTYAIILIVAVIIILGVIKTFRNINGLVKTVDTGIKYEIKARDKLIKQNEDLNEQEIQNKKLKDEQVNEKTQNENNNEQEIQDENSNEQEIQNTEQDEQDIEIENNKVLLQEIDKEMKNIDAYFKKEIETITNEKENKEEKEQIKEYLKPEKIVNDFVIYDSFDSPKISDLLSYGRGDIVLFCNDCDNHKHAIQQIISNNPDTITGYKYILCLNKVIINLLKNDLNYVSKEDGNPIKLIYDDKSKLHNDYKLINDTINDDFFTLIISKYDEYTTASLQTCDKIKMRKAYLTLSKYKWISSTNPSPNELHITLSREDFDEMFPDF